MTAALRRAPVRTLLAGILTAAIFVALLARKIDPAAVTLQVASASSWIVGLSLVTKFLGMAATAARTRLLLRPVHRYSVRETFRAALLAHTVNTVVPLRVGELARVDYLARRGNADWSACIAVVVFERLLDLIVLIALFTSVSLAVGMRVPVRSPLLVLTAVTAALLLALVWISGRPDTFRRVVEAAAGVLGARVRTFASAKASRFIGGLGSLESKRDIALAVLLTVGFWTSAVGSLQLWFWGFHLRLPWYAPFVALGFVSLATAISPAPAQIGTYHYFLMLALTTLGTDAQLAASVAIVGHFMAVVPFALLGMPLLFTVWNRTAQAGAARPPE